MANERWTVDIKSDLVSVENIIAFDIAMCEIAGRLSDGSELGLVTGSRELSWTVESEVDAIAMLERFEKNGAATGGCMYPEE